MDEILGQRPASKAVGIDSLNFNIVDLDVELEDAIMSGIDNSDEGTEAPPCSEQSTSNVTTPSSEPLLQLKKKSKKEVKETINY